MTDDLPESVLHSREPSASPTEPGKRGGKLATLVGAIVFVALLVIFHQLATRKAANDNSGIREDGQAAVVFHDQQPYLNVARKLVDENYQWVVPRHRMPGYSLLLIPLYDPETAYPLDPTGQDERRISEAFFERGKTFNIFLALGVLVVLFFLCRRAMPTWEALLVTWSFGFLLAVIRAPYVQPETLFYLTFFLSAALLVRQLESPTWKNGILAGIALAATFILKSAVIPLLALFFACFGLKFLVDLVIEWRSSKTVAWGASLGRIGKALVVPVVFVSLLSPYLLTTWKLFGSPFWDVHSKYYMWMDTAEEKKKWRDLDIAKPGFVPPEGEAPPSFAKYAREHEVADFIERPRVGWDKLAWRLKADYRPLVRWLWEFCRWVVIVTLLLHWREVLAALRKHWAAALMVAGYFIGYTLLYSWYASIGVGPRLILGLALPLIGLAFFLVGRFGGVTRLPRLGIQFNDRRIALVVLTLAGLYLGWQVVSDDLWRVEGGQ